MSRQSQRFVIVSNVYCMFDLISEARTEQKTLCAVISDRDRQFKRGYFETNAQEFLR